VLLVDTSLLGGYPSGVQARSLPRQLFPNRPMPKKAPLILLIAFVSSTSLVRAEVKLPAIFSDHMVLLKAEKVPVWGKADAGEDVSVSLDGQTVRTTAGEDGLWQVELNLSGSPPGPFEMTVQGKNTIRIADVVVGEVWMAGGQSNMELPMMTIINASAEIAASSNAMLRQYITRKLPSPHDLIEGGEGYWTVAKPGTTATFSALQYFFGKEIQTSLGVPVGIINACWGGKPIEPFISTNSVAASPLLRPAAETLWQRITSQNAAFKSWLTATGRDDCPAGEISAFTTGPLSTGWTAVGDSGAINSPDLPKYGAIWFRKDVTIPAEQLGSVQVLELGPIAMFDRVYVNGTLVGQTSLQTYKGPKSVRHYLIPPSVLREGTNQLAVRIFAPSLSPGFSWAPKIGKTALGGGWKAKPEFSLSAPEVQAPTITPQFAAYSSLFNGMIHPLLPYGIQGVIWYQGEANVKTAYDYRTSFPLLIQDWRQQWGKGSLPFYFCQLANHLAKTNTPGESKWAELREAQLMALSVPNTGMAVLIDTGESKNIHPQSKDIAGQRLAKIALANVYGQSIPYSGPLYESMTVEGDKIRLRFKYAEDGLVAQDLPAQYEVRRTAKETAPLVRNSPESELEGFAICGEDKKWVWADAKIDGETVLVWSDEVKAPVAVRYAWSDNPTCNLSSKAGLPASPFRTDDFPLTTQK
jgi:sialate O-acetylesterase